MTRLDSDHMCGDFIRAKKVVTIAVGIEGV